MIFQSRDDARLVELSGATVAALGGGVVYAPAAELSLSGSAAVGSASSASPLIVNQLVLGGNVVADLLADGGNEDGPEVPGQLAAGDVAVYVDNSSGDFTPDELARIADAVASADATVSPYGSAVTEVTDPALATTVISIGATSPAGSATDGVLGCEVPDGIDLVTGWDWYTGPDPSAVAPDQYDFETIVLHELGHALGLGHSQDPASTMFATLATGQSKRTLVPADLDIPDTDTGPCALHASTPAGLATPAPAPIIPVAQFQASAEVELPIYTDLAPARKPDAPAPARAIPSANTVVVRPRPVTRPGTALDRVLDQWATDSDELLDGIAEEVATAKKPKLGQQG